MSFQNAIGFFESLGVQPEVITDVDGNVYTYVTIGTQQWLVENLKTTKYADGTPIPNITNNTLWKSDTTGAYCWYNNDIANKTPYGALYNWYAVDNVHGFAPIGWRVPSVADFATLISYLGGIDVAGEPLKEVGTSHWDNPNLATNETGFTGVPSGRREEDAGVFQELGNNVDYWTSEEHDLDDAYVGMELIHDLESLLMDFFFYKRNGLSVRCMRDI